MMIVLANLFTEKNNANDADSHKDLGLIAAKYVETLQRSNEQLVKLINIKQKQTTQDIGLSDEDKASLFDMIQGDN